MADGAVSVRAEGDVLRVSGVLSAATVVSVLNEGRAAIAALGGTRAVLDLRDVASSDSAGLALIIDWLRTANAHSLQLEIHHVPDQMQALAGVSGLNVLFAHGVDDGS